MHFGGAMFFTDYSMSAMELARALEERGFESVWAPEHSHIPLSRKTPFPGGGDLPKQYYDAMDPFVVLAAASQATKTIKLGTGVLLVQQRDAIQTAKLVASIDQVSQGRFLFGVGGGWNQDEMEDHGTVYATRFKRMRESIEGIEIDEFPMVFRLGFCPDFLHRLEYGPTEILPQVGALSKHTERLCRPGRQASRAHPRGKPGFSTFESGCGRETDSPLEGDGFEPSVPQR